VARLSGGGIAPAVTEPAAATRCRSKSTSLGMGRPILDAPHRRVLAWLYFCEDLVLTEMKEREPDFGGTHRAVAHKARISPSASCTVRLFGCPRTLSSRSITESTSRPPDISLRETCTTQCSKRRPPSLILSAPEMGNPPGRRRAQQLQAVYR